MKTNFLKSSILTLAVSAFAMFALTSCDKDDDPTPKTIQQQIVGTWDFTSFKVDTSEYMGVIVDSSTIRFEAYTGVEGNFRQTVLYIGGERETLDGKYQVDETKKELKMTAQGETETAQITFTTSSKMEWKGEDEGLPVVVKAIRK